MKLRPIYLATLVHLFICIVLMLWSLAITGYGFKDHLTAIEALHVYMAISLTTVFVGPLLLLLSLLPPTLPSIGTVLFLPLMAINSFLQVNIFLYVAALVRRRRAT